MGYSKRLNPKQKRFLDDLFSGEYDESEVLERHKVSSKLYHKWLRDVHFRDEFSQGVAALRRQSEFIIARFAGLAAAKLVGLTESDKEETARKACLDVISLPGKFNAGDKEVTKDKAEEMVEIDGETASKILSVLAESDGL